jgi:threonine dehydrogenase-like Zn-dependent dehydrogenase
MKAWRTYGIGDMRLDEVPMPQVKPGWALVKMKTIQVSVTEVALFQGTSGNIEKQLEVESPRQLFGHEFCGEVVEVGENVTNLSKGDRVSYCCSVSCHECALCLAGYEDLCCKGPKLGLDIPGVLAEYALLSAAGLVVLPDSVTDSEGAALQPLAGTLGALALVGVEMGDTVAVLGQGSMGLNATQICRVCGAGKVIGVDITESNLDMSKKLGADMVINAKTVDPVDVVMEATHGVGADLVVECAGGSPKQGLSGTSALSQAMQMVRDKGRISQIALLGANAQVDISPLNQSGVMYRGLSSGSRKLAQYAVDLVATRRVQLAPLVTHELEGLDKMLEAIEITGNKAKYGAINPAQVKVV